MSNPYDWTSTSEYIITTDIVKAVTTALAASPGGAVARASVVPGSAIAWDECDCEGSLMLAVNRHFRTRNFPQDASGTYTKCQDTKLVVDCSLAIIRCVSGVDENGDAPTPEQLGADAATQGSDAFTVWEAAQCILSQMEQGVLITDYIINDQSYTGPQGNCAGSELHFQFGLMPPSPCGSPC